MQIKQYRSLCDSTQAECIDVRISSLPRAFDGYKIVQISDVHLSKNTSDVPDILKMAERQNPDWIFTTGDIINNYANIRTSGFMELYRGLVQICDVYAVTGNHELRSGTSGFWMDLLNQMGVYGMDNRYTVIEKKRQKLAVMGLEGNTPFGAEIFGDLRKIKELPKILLAHRPEFWKVCLSDACGFRPDLTFSGHAHGGQIRVPLIGGIYSPGQGLFPGYTTGLYTAGYSALFVSRGLANRIFPPRINNRPHLPVIRLRYGGSG